MKAVAYGGGTNSTAMLIWMQGHCWALSSIWDGGSYRGTAENGNYVCPRAINTRQLWAAWRDRAALAQPAEVKQLKTLMDVTIEDEAAKLLRDYLTSDDDEPSPVRLLLGDGHSGHGLYLAAAEYPEEGAILLTEVAQPAEPVELSDDELAAFLRFDETCADDQSYDIPKPMMRRLAEIGLVCRLFGAFYKTTEYGMKVLEAAAKRGAV